MTASSGRTPDSAAGRARSTHVLVIDDSDVDRQVLVDILSGAGFNVHELPSPIGATRKARELKVSIVVIDQNLPSLDGSKLAVLFRSAGLSDLKVVLVSSSDEAEMLDIVQKAKADAFVPKQRMRTELVPALHKLLRG